MASFKDVDAIQNIMKKKVVSMGIHSGSTAFIPGVQAVRLTFEDNTALILRAGGVSSDGNAIFIVEEIADISVPGASNL